MSLEKNKDSHGNYFEFSKINKSLSTIFIHGVGLDNTMWYPQKSYFKNKSAIFYDLINHGRSIGNYQDLSFEIYSNQLLNLINERSKIYSKALFKIKCDNLTKSEVVKKIIKVI